MKIEKDLFGICPYTTAQKLITGKWTFLIIYNLCQGTLRFGELHRRIPEITQSALTKQLRSLEENALINRLVYSEIPPKVEYSMTDIGRELLPVLEQFHLFGEKYIAYMKTEGKGK